jgi:hypothetical protein
MGIVRPGTRLANLQETIVKPSKSRVEAHLDAACFLEILALEI